MRGRVQQQCKRCGKSFETWGAWVRNGRMGFCSRECRLSVTSEERFRAKTAEGKVPAHRPELGACRVWTGSRSHKGYGWFWFEGELRQAHRVAFFVAHGRWPNPHALHHCDNPGCVRADHLFEGDDAANAADRDAKGREASHVGTLNGRAYLNEDIVRSIRAAYADGEQPTAISRRLGIKLERVKSVVQRRSWKHVA